MSKFGKIIFFISSYIPLYVLLVVLNFDIKGFKNSSVFLLKNRLSYKSVKFIISTFNLSDALVFGLLLLIIISFALLLLTIKYNSNFKEEMQIYNISNNNTELLNYIVVYIFSFANSMFAEFQNIYMQKILVFVLLFILIGYFYIKNNMIYINPVIYFVFGYNIYKINTKSSEIILLTKLSPHELKKLFNKSIYPEVITEGIYILK